MSLHRHPDSPLLDHCPETLPAWTYHDPGWYAKEQGAIWAREWIHVGRKNDLAPGTMRRIEVAGQSLILCHDREGRITCFHNTCRHRGAELCSADESPLGKLITCKYHNWAYATDGRLVSTAFGTPTADFRREDHGLFAVHVREWNGFLYVCLAPEAPDLVPDMGLSALENWPMATLVTGHRTEKRLKCNWKVFWENYNECLHCPGVHPELCDMVPIYRQGIMAANEAPDWSPEAPRPASNLREGAVTWTATGKPCGPEFPDLTPEERASGYIFVTVYPTMFIVAHVDHVRAVTLAPIGPEETRLTAQWLFPAETLAQPGFDPAEVASFATIVMNQDAEVAEMNQRGLKSDRFKKGRLMPQEFDIHRFHHWVRARMEAAGEVIG
ncbi:aromatic ring-hydroxylating dioxygenase subunit alpha [Defluviimonas sp. WL0002]|uniref:Aromatic ring-hydroxylating dioxygenase subunit alpha n=1 Tax=Albidovulum marisflavi TaxID=2984159 RepID=A0ABT2Z9H2_9RHOB|nr:aromatic ring-hydroxylating dioxygenase subunit alpha [Defluviimonas sp. WL0002]MCV2867722.1 aromatic ring-hydroxylating dioxygenase subunit alpha [Defluviimonas sp. WL0002]